MSQETTVEGQKLVIKRTFDAPIEKVYRAWTDPAQMARWLSPNTRWIAPRIEIEHVEGGCHNITLRHSDGDEIHIVGRYVEILPNERISFTWKPLESAFGADETLVTVAFRAVPNGTELTLIHDRQADPKTLEGASLGWSGCLDMLESYLAGGSALGGQ